MCKNWYMQYNAKTFEEYLRQLDPERRAVIDTLQALVFKVAPDGEEPMRCGMPAYSRNGIFCAFASQENYITFYFMNIRLFEKCKAHFKGLNADKSCIRLTKPDLLRDIIKQMFIELL